MKGRARARRRRLKPLIFTHISDRLPRKPVNTPVFGTAATAIAAAAWAKSASLRASTKMWVKIRAKATRLTQRKHPKGR
jgi:hypothetical protein